MFDMDLDWWEFILRAAIVYAVLLIMVRVAGKRTIGQFSPFDLLVVMILSEAVSGSLTGSDGSVQGGLLVAATLLGLNTFVEMLTSRSTRMERTLEGAEALVGRHGVIFDKVLKANRMTRSEIEHALRQADMKLEEMDYAILEADGTISVGKNPPQLGEVIAQQVSESAAK